MITRLADRIQISFIRSVIVASLRDGRPMGHRRGCGRRVNERRGTLRWRMTSGATGANKDERR